MYLAINRFKVRTERAADFEKVWKSRESQLSGVPGFVRFHLYRSDLRPEAVEFLSHTEWVNQESFEAWRHSEASRKSHARSSQVADMLFGPPEFSAYRTVLDQVPGHRTDYRSVFIDRKVESHFVRETPFQKDILRKAGERGLPAINIGPFEGQLLMMWLRSLGARTGVEVGSLGGYSASWLLRGLAEGGKLYTLELESERAAWIAEDFRGVDSRLEVLAGPAKDSLNGVLADLKNLDFVFIDADKRGYPDYVEWAKGRVRSGGLILLDNSYIWGGMNYWKENWQHPKEGDWDSFQKGAFDGMSKSWEMLSEDPQFDALVVPTGEGLLAALKK